MAHGEELLRRDDLIDRALEAKKSQTQQKGRSPNWNAKQKNKEMHFVIDTKVQALPTDELFEYLQQDEAINQAPMAMGNMGGSPMAQSTLAHTSAPFNPSGMSTGNQS